MAAYRARDYLSSYLQGGFDGRSWSNRAHPGEIHSMARLEADQITPDKLQGAPVVLWMFQRVGQLGLTDSLFHANAYYEGFLDAVRKARGSTGVTGAAA